MPSYIHVLIGINEEKYYYMSSYKRFYIKEGAYIEVENSKNETVTISSDDIERVLNQEIYLRDTMNREDIKLWK